MGRYVQLEILDAKINNLTYSEYLVFLYMGRSCDDNSKTVEIRDSIRKNFIGDHVYISIKQLSEDLGVSRKTLNNAVKGLIEKGYIRKSKQDNNLLTNCYQINISLVTRMLDFHVTRRTMSLDMEDEKVKKFYDTVTTVYENDFDDPPFQELTTEEKGLIIDIWEDLLDNKELEEVWQTYRDKKKDSVGDNNTTLRQNKKDHEDELSLHENSTNDNNTVTQNNPYPYSGEELKNVQPDITKTRLKEFSYFSIRLHIQRKMESLLNWEQVQIL